MKYWILSFFTVATLLFILSCTDDLTGNNGDDNNGNNNDSTTTTVPSAPTNVSATKGSSSVYIYITWTPVTGEGVTRYLVYKSSNPNDLNNKGSYDKVAEADTSDTTFMKGYYRDSLTYLSNQRYYYRVVAINYYGESEWSNVDSGWVYYIDPIDTTPQPFEDEPLSSINAEGNINILWNIDTSAIYKVYKSKDDTLNWVVIDSNADTPFVDTSDLLPGTTYYYALTKTPSGGVEGLKSDPMMITTKSLGPDSLWASDIKATSFRVTWNSVPGAVMYGVYVIRDSINTIADKYPTDTTTTLSVSDGGTDVSLVVNANISGTYSYFSDTLTIKTLYRGPGQVTATTDQEKFISISWNKLVVGTDSIEGAIYTLYKGTDTSNMVIIDSTLTTTSYIDSNVIADTVYHYKVKAVDSTGHPSEFSYLASGKSIETITFVAPDTLWKELGIDTGIILHWNNAFGAASYKLYRKSSYDVNDTWHEIASPTDTLYHDKTTIDRIGYSYAVSTISDSSEESEKYTNTTTFASTGDDFSYIDVSLTADTSTANKITINWSKTPNGSEESYVIYRKQNSELMTIVETVDTSVTSWIDTSVVSADTMQYVVDPVFDIGGIKYKTGVITLTNFNNSVIVVAP